MSLSCKFCTRKNSTKYPQYLFHTSVSLAFIYSNTILVREDNIRSRSTVSGLGFIKKVFFSFSKRISIAILLSGDLIKAVILSFALNQYKFLESLNWHKYETQKLLTAERP